MSAKYKFESSYAFKDEPIPNKPATHRRHSRRTSRDSENGDDADPTDGSGSLTYSAASSINSAAGESTDSSFADIMKVLDVQDSKELASYLQKERPHYGGGSHGHHSHLRRDERSVAESLAYSTDAESQMRSLATTDGDQSLLHGTDIMSTITGQTSDQFAYDGSSSMPVGADSRQAGGASQNNHNNSNDLDILFSPAEHADSMKRRKDKKRLKKKTQGSHDTADADSYSLNAQPSNTTSAAELQRQYSTAASAATTPTRSAAAIAAAAASMSPRAAQRPPKSHHLEMREEEDVWYAKWWMFCFPDAKNMAPKR